MKIIKVKWSLVAVFALFLSQLAWGSETVPVTILYISNHAPGTAPNYNSNSETELGWMAGVLNENQYVDDGDGAYNFNTSILSTQSISGANQIIDSTPGIVIVVIHGDDRTGVAYDEGGPCNLGFLHGAQNNIFTCADGVKITANDIGYSLGTRYGSDYHAVTNNDVKRLVVTVHHYVQPWFKWIWRD